MPKKDTYHDPRPMGAEFPSHALIPRQELLRTKQMTPHLSEKKDETMKAHTMATRTERTEATHPLPMVLLLSLQMEWSSSSIMLQAPSPISPELSVQASYCCHKGDMFSLH